MSADYFVNILRKNEIFVDIVPDSDKVDADEKSVHITCLEPAKAFRQLEVHFRLQKAKVNDFIDAMSHYFDLPDALTSSLLPLDGQEGRNHQPSERINSMYGQADTFLKLLLRLEVLQQAIIEILLSKMLLILGEESPTGGEDSHHRDAQELLATQVFNNIRWCELLFNPQSVVRTLLDSVQVLPSSLQIEIVMSIPAILPQAIGEDLLTDLLGLARAIPSLLPCILETVGNLCLTYGSEGYNEVIRFALDELNMADIILLPVLTRFLLESAGAENAGDIWRETRSKLVQFVEISSSSIDKYAEWEETSERSREWLDFQTIIISLLRSAFTTSPSKTILFQALVATITPTDDWGASGE